MKKKHTFCGDVLPWIFLIVVAGILALEIWEIVAQLQFDGQYLTWRFIPIWQERSIVIRGDSFDEISISLKNCGRQCKVA